MSLSQTSSRSHSFASTSSTNSNKTNHNNSTTLAETAKKILSSLSNNNKNTTSTTDSTETLKTLSQYLSPQISIQHNDDLPTISSRETYLSTHLNKIKSLPPTYRLEVQETCVDESQMKVWVQSEITGLADGVRRRSISMLGFNEEGVLVSSVDYFRRVREGDDDEEEEEEEED